MADTYLHSRSVLAGYDPDRLEAARILIVGLGALGQNVAQNLALVGAGHLILVDFDDFEGHNATRSPFFPTHSEVARLGRGKAPTVAHRVAQVSTASDASVHYSADLIQVLGDGAVAWADVVISAVDSTSARAWLAERCRLLARPMIEGGFSGPVFNLSAFAPDSGACYRCGRPERESSMSCTAYALAAERAQIVPAIQTSAAVLGGYQAEQVIQILHGNVNRFGQRTYGDVRRETLLKAMLDPDPNCPGIHQPQPVIGEVHDLTGKAVLSDLITAVRRQFGGGLLRFAEPVIPLISCTRCRKPCLVQATESSWLADPKCQDCGGRWAVTSTYAPDSVTAIATDDELSEELASTPLDDLGIRAGACLAVQLNDERSGLLRIEGDILTCVRRATGEDSSALEL